MNAILLHRSSNFSEVHPLSFKSLPMNEDLECAMTAGIDAVVMRFAVPLNDPEKPGATVAPNKLMLERVKKYAVAPEGLTKFTGKWVFKKASKTPIRHENGGVMEIQYDENLFVLEGQGSSIAFRMQRNEDGERMASVCPIDQTRTFNARWTDATTISITVSGIRVDGLDPIQDEIVKISPLDNADLEELAAMVGVDWNPKASRETNIESIAKARVEKKNKLAAKPVKDAKPEKVTA